MDCVRTVVSLPCCRSSPDLRHGVIYQTIIPVLLTNQHNRTLIGLRCTNAMKNDPAARQDGVRSGEQSGSQLLAVDRPGTIIGYKLHSQITSSTNSISLLGLLNNVPSCMEPYF